MEAPIGEFEIDRLKVKVFRDRAALGRAAAGAAAARIRALQQRGRFLNLLFASGLSQVQTLQALRDEPGIRWERVCAFHMDEYVGLPADAPQAFGQFLRDRLFNGLPLGQVFYIDGNAPDLKKECERYARLLQEHPLDLGLMGIGENGHLAFNDPPANFETEEPYLIVTLDERCRLQQVGEGWFQSPEQVPAQAISMSVRQILRSRQLVATVPDLRKADAVKNALDGPVTPQCPASIVQQHENCSVFLDEAAASRLSGEM
jgi:glucosamine-6-phosphate deaminase